HRDVPQRAIASFRIRINRSDLQRSGFCIELLNEFLESSSVSWASTRREDFASPLQLCSRSVVPLAPVALEALDSMMASHRADRPT
ncbi:hypothetical protein, partial [Enterobacter hormaechei]|uniref:hypothetical protein n=1 Tax=Enterobacter hormaechei TaxID=158836 RepID=UPI001953282D